MYRPLFAIFFLLFPLSVSCAHSAQAPLAPTPGAPLLSVLTFNVNYGMRDAPENLRAIVEADADLVLLQETTPALDHVFHDARLRALDVEIIDAGASDHLPVKVWFEGG